jgi:regulator of replication initiation timing
LYSRDSPIYIAALSGQSIAGSDLSTTIIERESRRGLSGLSLGEVLLLVLLVLLLGLAGILQYSERQLAGLRNKAEAIISGAPVQQQAGQQGPAVLAPIPAPDARQIHEQTLRIGALEGALRDAKRDTESLRDSLAAVKPLRRVADSAVALDPKQPPQLLLERGLAALGALGAQTKDPARAITDMKSENEDFRRKLTANIRENDQLRRDKDALARESRQEIEALRAEVATLKPLKALSDAAAKVDPRQPPAQVMQRALTAFDALGAVNDPARLVSDMRADNEALKQKLAALDRDLEQARQDKQALTHKADSLTQENNALSGEKIAAPNENDALSRERDARMSEDRKEIEALRAEIATLAPLRSIVDTAAKLDPGQPPASVVQRALARLQTTETTGTTDRNTVTDSDIGALRIENDELRQKLAKAEAASSHTAAPAHEKEPLPPPCWTNAQGEAQYLLDVTIKDEGLLVRDLMPAARASDPRIKSLRSLPRGVDINPELFRRVIDPVFRATVRDQCRFVVTMRDGTGPASKQIYKGLRRLVESYFYVKHL